MTWRSFALVENAYLSAVSNQAWLFKVTHLTDAGNVTHDVVIGLMAEPNFCTGPWHSLGILMLPKTSLLSVELAEIKTWAFWRAILSELLGMTVFVFTGLSAATGKQHHSYPDQKGNIALALGLAVATLAQCVCYFSGSDLNPAIAVDAQLPHESSSEHFFYIIAQLRSSGWQWHCVCY